MPFSPSIVVVVIVVFVFVQVVLVAAAVVLAAVVLVLVVNFAYVFCCFVVDVNDVVAVHVAIAVVLSDSVIGENNVLFHI